MLPEASPEQIFAAPGERKTSEWVTVLTAMNIPFELIYEGSRWIIRVDADHADQAQAQLDAYEAEVPFQRDEQPAAATPGLSLTDSWSPLWVAVFLAVFYVWLGPYHRDSPLLVQAAADAGAIRSGEWWRILTALAVHGGPVHLLGNLVAILLLGHAACRRFGRGIAWVLILLTAAGGNLLSAWLFQTERISVGASTACFSALGLLAASQAARNLHTARRGAARPGYAWIPLAAGFAMLTMLGIGPNSDLAAHLAGFLAGLLLFFPFAAWGDRWCPPWGQMICQVIALCTMMAAWRQALQATVKP